MTLQMYEEAAMAAIAFQAVHRLPESRPMAPEIGAATALRPLDPDVVSAAIPAFFIGRNRAGLWVAREARGRSGGLFLFRSSAIDFANRRSAPARCALVFPAETFELDVENKGNPLVALAARPLSWLKRRVPRLAR
ncbi:hypothetical protein E4K66_08600 [Bradyrhizobium frederickii]|uniref:Uncharacterized protein n=1 Tax=Bradyrhizobium frederickii TaxID=2560054 RepID=A0A4Y9LC10_9BRAD|nr:hypothetical protein [Bradyrhizobium frederickii]TFV40885.1 hypothetical protein E4K66_08600 [Bradyrhizobium frederickii]